MLLKSLIAGLVMTGMLGACAVNLNINDTQLLGTSETEEDRILAVLDAQEAAWNRGDIDGYMQSYWQSPDLRFASGGTVVRGWQATRDRYHARYSNRDLMGQLSTLDLEISLFGLGENAVAHGGWALARADDHPSGLFTLILRKIDGDWKIVSDTTTLAD